MTTPLSFSDQFNNLGTFGQIGVGASVFGAAMSIGSAFYTAKTQKIALDAQSKMAAISARMAELFAKSAIQAGIKEQEAYSLRAGQKKAETLTTFASRGFLQSGSVSDVLTGQDYIASIDKANIELNALNQAFGLKSQALNLRADAVGKKYAAESISPFMSGVGAAAQSGANLFSTFAAMKSLGGG